MPSIDECEAHYTSLFGYFPPHIRRRIEREKEIDPLFLDKLEDLRAYAIEPKALELKVAQMIMFAILLNNQTASGARAHAIAALRAGATEHELHAVAGLAFLCRGLAALNMGAETIAAALEYVKANP